MNDRDVKSIKLCCLANENTARIEELGAMASQIQSILFATSCPCEPNKTAGPGCLLEEIKCQTVRLNDLSAILKSILDNLN